MQTVMKTVAAVALAWADFQAQHLQQELEEYMLGNVHVRPCAEWVGRGAYDQAMLLLNGCSHGLCGML